MNDEFTLTLNSPITEEQWDMITDVDFDNTNEITFHTKYGKEVKFVKASAQPEPCEDAVSRKAAVEEIRRHGVGSFDFEDYTPEQAERFVIKLLQDLPSVTPKRKTGKWNHISDGYVDIYECDQCRETEDYERNYCSNCGAKMEG